MAEENQIIDTTSKNLSEISNNLVTEIINEEDPNKVEDLTKLFELNQKKKNIARINKLSKLLTLVDDEAITRFVNAPETFDSEILLKYMNSTQNAISSLEQSNDNKPTIQINNQTNEINLGDSGLNRESRKRVLAAVMEILDKSKKQDAIDIKISDLEENE